MIDYDAILASQRKRIALIPLTMYNDLEEHYRETDNLRVVEIHPVAATPAVFEEIEKYKESFVVLRTAPGLREALLASGYEFILVGWTVPSAPERFKDEMIEWRDTQSDRISKVFVTYRTHLGDALAALAAYKAI